MSCLEPLGEFIEMLSGRIPKNLTENWRSMLWLDLTSWIPKKRFEVRNWNGLLHYVGRVSSHNLQMNIWNLVGSCVSVEWKNTSPKNSPHNFQGTKWNLDFVSWILVHWKSQGTNIFYPWNRKLINSNMSQGVVWGYGRPEFFPS